MTDRPDDVPSWKACWKQTVRMFRWTIPIMLIAVVVMVRYLPSWMLAPDHGGFTPAQAVAVARLSDWRAVAAFEITTLIFLIPMMVLTATGLRQAETPKEIKARELRKLAALKAKYESPAEKPMIEVWDKGTSV